MFIILKDGTIINKNYIESISAVYQQTYNCNEYSNDSYKITRKICNHYEFVISVVSKEKFTMCFDTEKEATDYRNDLLYKIIYKKHI